MFVKGLRWFQFAVAVLLSSIVVVFHSFDGQNPIRRSFISLIYNEHIAEKSNFKMTNVRCPCSHRVRFRIYCCAIFYVEWQNLVTNAASIQSLSLFLAVSVLIQSDVIESDKHALCIHEDGSVLHCILNISHIFCVFFLFSFAHSLQSDTKHMHAHTHIFTMFILNSFYCVHTVMEWIFFRSCLVYLSI